MGTPAQPEDDQRDYSVAWTPQDGPQVALVTCPVFEVFYGGARGGGKTDGVLGDWIGHADQYGEDAVGLMVRRSRVELIETIERSRAIYAKLGAQYHEQDKMWRFPNGARLRFSYLDRDADADQYQGHSYTRVYIEEIGNFPTSKPILKLMATLRSGAGVPVAFRATGNPGGPGHQWVRDRYIRPAPLGWKVIKDETSGLERVYIPSRVTDNHYLGSDYIQRLKASGSDALVRAWLEGDWDAIEGAFFDQWRTDKHVVAAFEIPAHWLRFRSLDWGYGAPFSVGWWAVVSEPVRLARGGDTSDSSRSSVFGSERRPSGHNSTGDDSHADEAHGKAGDAHGGDRSSADANRQTPSGRLPDCPGASVIPRGALIRYREWYGSTGEPNVGLRLEAEDIARGIIAREVEEKIAFAVADTQVFAQEGQAYGYKGPTIGERLNKTLAAAQHQIFRGADKSRKQGWDQVRARLRGDLDGNPMLVVFDTCIDVIRTLPVLQHDPLDPEDLDTKAEDHAVDELRYACMARPWAAPTPQPDKPLIDTRIPTLAAVVKATMRKRQNQDGRIT